MSIADLAAALGGARREGNGWRCHCPLAQEHSNGDADPSLSVRDRGDGTLLVHCHSRHANEQDRVIEALKARGLWPTSANGTSARTSSHEQRKKGSDDDFECLSPVSAEAPSSDSAIKWLGQKLGAARRHRFDYRNEAGALLFHVCRFESPAKDKVIRPLSLWRNRRTGKLLWRWKWPPAPLPLLGLEKLARYPDLTLLLVEGELKCERASELLTHYVILSLPGGAKAVGKVDLTPLVGRRFICFPDNDKDGFDAMIAVVRKLEAMQVQRAGAITHSPTIVTPDPEWAPKQDIADLIAEGWDAQRLLTYIQGKSVGIEEFEQHARNVGKQSIEKRKALGILAADVKVEPVEFLINHLIPRGKLTLIAGDPGKGKSLLAAELAARVSRGIPWLDGSPCAAEPVFVLSAEDAAADTLVPRLRAAGADLSRIRVCDVEDLLSLPDEIERLEEAVKAMGARLVVLDPLNSFLDGRINPHQDASVRRALAPLSALADRTGAAVIVVFHLNKDGGADGKQALYRPTGSIGFVAASRAAFLLAPSPENKDQRVLAPLKFNLGPMPPSWAFEIQETEFPVESPNHQDGHLNRVIKTARIHWIGESSLTADALLGRGVAGHEDEGKLAEATAFLRGLLADGAKPHRAIADGARANRISDSTLRRAAQTLRIIVFQSRSKTGKRGSPGWLWRLPNESGDPDDSDDQPPGDGCLNHQWPRGAVKSEQTQGFSNSDSDGHDSDDQINGQVNHGVEREHFEV